LREPRASLLVLHVERGIARAFVRCLAKSAFLVRALYAPNKKTEAAPGNSMADTGRGHLRKFSRYHNGPVDRRRCIEM